MKKNIRILFVVMLVFPLVLSASDKVKFGPGEEEVFNEYNWNASLENLGTSDSEYNLSTMNLQVDVIGVLFFGPQVTLDFQFADMIAVGPYLRWHYAGLIYQGVVTDWFTDGTTTSLASYGVGAQAKFLIPVGSGQHRPYVEVGFEKSFGSDYWDPGGDWGKRIYEYESNVIHINLGYRLLTNSSFNLSAAVGIGFSQDTRNVGFYEFGDDPIDHYALESRVLPMVQLMLGWQLGK